MSSILHTAFDLVKTFPGLSIAVTAALILLPVIIEMIDFVLRLRGAH